MSTHLHTGGFCLFLSEAIPPFVGSDYMHFVQVLTLSFLGQGVDVFSNGKVSLSIF